jgi:hypothetical protein
VARLGRYFREELGPPVTVALEEVPITQLPPDGQQFREPAARQDPYYRREFLLADPAGRFLLPMPTSGVPTESLLDAWVACATGGRQ